MIKRMSSSTSTSSSSSSSSVMTRLLSIVMILWTIIMTLSLSSTTSGVVVVVAQQQQQQDASANSGADGASPTCTSDDPTSPTCATATTTTTTADETTQKEKKQLPKTKASVIPMEAAQMMMASMMGNGAGMQAMAALNSGANVADMMNNPFASKKKQDSENDNAEAAATTETEAAAEEETVDDNEDNDQEEDDDQDEDDNTTSNGKPKIDWDAFTMYADRHAKRLEELKSDYDCMEREFDFNSPTFDYEEVAFVYDKCRLVVLRNVFDVEFMEQYRLDFDKYIYGIHTGQIDRSNTPTNDAKANDIVQYRGSGRHDIMLSKYLSKSEIANNERILKLMSHDLMLGSDAVPNQVGSVIAEKGCDPMYWHEDQTWLYGTEGFNHAGIAGHDLLPYVINLFVPLGNVTAASGPTEFCMGATHLSGIPEDLTGIFYDEKYGHPNSDFMQMHDFQWELDACPPQFWRRPLIGAGDVVLFDYHLTHRGGPNQSDELRALLYVIYARSWFRDLNFDTNHGDQGDPEEEWMSGLRYTLVDEADVAQQVRLLQRVSENFHNEHDHYHDKEDTNANANANTNNNDEELDIDQFVQDTMKNVQSFAGMKGAGAGSGKYATMMDDEKLSDKAKYFYSSVNFKLTNIDGKGSIWIGNTMKLDSLDPLSEYEVSARPYETMTLRSEDDTSIILNQWKIGLQQRQIVITA